jgi:hypothetical protein
MKRKTPVIVFVGILALGAWAAAGYMVWADVTGMEDFAVHVRDSRQSEARRAETTHTHLLVESMASVRNDLTKVLQVDFVSIVDMIESTGAASGVTVRIVDAVPDAPHTDPDSEAQITTVHFLISVDGSFAALTKVASLLETLPVASRVESIDLSRAGADAKGKDVWHMGVRLTVLTSSHINS